jgi:RimJ/RimL family protein N-acetyltransferase
MNYQVGDVILRRPEPSDLEALYQQKNDPEIAGLLGGFTTGYSRQDIKDWIEYHRQQKDEVIWAIVCRTDGTCLGHVGLYQIDFRVRSAEFAILIGDHTAWNQGIGTNCTKSVIEYGFGELNLNRIHLSVLSSNERAIRLYQKLGFREEGRLRQAQYKHGQYLDILIMALLREEYSDGTGI